MPTLGHSASEPARRSITTADDSEDGGDAADAAERQRRAAQIEQLRQHGLLLQRGESLLPETENDIEIRDLIARVRRQCARAAL